MSLRLVMAMIGRSARHREFLLDELFPLPSGHQWAFVPDSPFPTQLRSIVRLNACAVVVWIGTKEANDRACRLIRRLTETGPPVIVAVTEAYDAACEAALREAGAVYTCADGAQLFLGTLLKSALDPPRCGKATKRAPSLRQKV